MDNITLTNENINPVNDLILIDPMLKATETAAGLQLPNQQDTENTPMIGEVLKCGDKVTLVKPGDKLLFRRYSADRVIHNDGTGEKNFWLLEQDSILGIIK